MSCINYSDAPLDFQCNRSFGQTVSAIRRPLCRGNSTSAYMIDMDGSELWDANIYMREATLSSTMKSIFFAKLSWSFSHTLTLSFSVSFSSRSSRPHSVVCVLRVHSTFVSIVLIHCTLCQRHQAPVPGHPHTQPSISPVSPCLASFTSCFCAPSAVRYMKQKSYD